MNQQILIGTTYSHREIAYLKLDKRKSLTDLLQFGFDVVRLCVYWDQVQPAKDILDFSEIKEILDECEMASQKVVVTVGMKAPRWPEFYIPQWVDQRPENTKTHILTFVERTINELQQYSCVTHWQIENEPLDPSGHENKIVPREILQKEVNLVKRLDTRPIVITLWGNELVTRNLLPLIKAMADIVGIDLYYKYAKNKEYSSVEQFTETVHNMSKPLWITELQAEPWEQTNELKFSFTTPSMDSHKLKVNFDSAMQLNPEVILFWGFEYWLWRKERGDESLWNSVKDICKSISKKEYQGGE